MHTWQKIRLSLDCSQTPLEVVWITQDPLLILDLHHLQSCGAAAPCRYSIGVVFSYGTFRFRQT